MSSPTRRALVLFVEDSEDDSFFFQWTIRKCGLDCELAHFADGTLALEHLESVRLGESPRPDVIFLDLKLPGHTGFEILAWLRRQTFNPPLPVVVLSGSEHGSDLERARQLGATSYHVKPISAAQLRTILTELPAEGMVLNEPMLLGRAE